MPRAFPPIEMGAKGNPWENDRALDKKAQAAVSGRSRCDGKAARVQTRVVVD